MRGESTEGELMLAVRQLHKSYGDVAALRGVDLEIAPGEVVGLLGPNGAGKTTFVSIVCGLVKPDSGRVEVDGIDAVAEPQLARRHLGLAGQELAVYPSLTVRENLVFFGELVSLRRDALRAALDETAEMLELTDLLDRPVRTLSGGQKRRLHTAGALLGRPPLLLLDEPTSGVDVASRARLLDAVKHLAAEGSAICYSTHYLHEVEQLDAKVAIVDRGRVIAFGAVADLVRAHGDAAVEVLFDGPPDGLNAPCPVEITGRMARLFPRQVDMELAGLLPHLATSRTRIQSIEFVEPSLEAVFLSLTGRRFAADEPAGHTSEEAADVVGS